MAFKLDLQLDCINESEIDYLLKEVKKDIKQFLTTEVYEDRQFVFCDSSGNYILNIKD